MDKPSNYFEVNLQSGSEIARSSTNTVASTGNFNAGNAQSAVVTNIPSTSGMKVGAIISDAGNTYIPAGTTIASIDSATQITMSVQTNAGAAAVGRAFNVSNDNNAVCIFDIGSVLDQTPHAQQFQDRSDCLMKLKYIAIERTAAEFTTALVSTVQFRTNVILPNSLESQVRGLGLPNMGTSDILGVVPVGNTTYTYSDLQNNPNDWVCAANPFRGQLNITLTDQDGTELSILQHKDWNAVLCIYFPPTEKVLGVNMPKLSY